MESKQESNWKGFESREGKDTLEYRREERIAFCAEIDIELTSDCFLNGFFF